MKHFSKIIATQEQLFHAFLIASLNEDNIDKNVEILLHKVGVNPNKNNLNFQMFDVKKTLHKSEILSAFNDLYFSSFTQQDEKVLLIKNIDLANTSILNAILKTLEEPPKNTLIILTTTHIDKVLPTIRSRCQVFNFYEDNKKEILEILNKENKAFEYNTLFVNIYSGLEQVKRNINDENLKLLKKIQQTLNKHYKSNLELINFFYKKLTKENALFLLSILKLFFFSIFAKDFSIFPSFWKDIFRNWENRLKQQKDKFAPKHFEIISLIENFIQSLETAQNFTLQKNNFLVNFYESLK
ncbi:AAA family ATPase [Mesomycoplasma hyorhinis]|uniref:AAA family ATPase n=1 Tax=Mesomycoplasma hyorhinis TaxID=2100 RepID=UPI001C0416C4|nr:AAA family ATPase [Mesomycoplasma hyorhinis]